MTQPSHDINPYFPSEDRDFLNSEVFMVFFDGKQIAWDKFVFQVFALSDYDRDRFVTLFCKLKDPSNDLMT